ncbi:RRXRR domain-containing protein [Spirulina sp. 06S082]|uniref:RRXRR domain-containing protein n=1 Tax=Spirulina sp. 06S082 TaxID=3110248 RepID=UPI002B21250E|nr:RRXRR domain-containing protein [Spirulina sp. 06S082]MEA5468154.1 RRXRR domain-containing protein [Spirulina sp. 06S082]
MKEDDPPLPPLNKGGGRVPVLSPEGKPLMPTKASRARRWLKEGKAKVCDSDLGVFCVQLLQEPSGEETQEIAVGIDSGKLFSGIGVVSTKATLFKAHLQLPFKSVIQKMTTRRMLRRGRRGRRINRKLPFEQRCHRQKRFNNRRNAKLPPSIRANRELELRVVKELATIYPISRIVYEIVKADVDLTSGRQSAKSGKGFSPVMVGQKIMVQWLNEIAPVMTKEGWETSILRKHLGLAKDKTDKSKVSPETHANDGLALACYAFVEYKNFIDPVRKIRGGKWYGSVQLTNYPLAVIARPKLYRRQLHFENPNSKKPNPNQYRKRKGGTITPYGFRSGDYVEAVKGKKTYQGWIGGYSEANKVVSLYDLNWRRIGQFSVSKTRLIKRSTRLLVEYKHCGDSSVA